MVEATSDRLVGAVWLEPYGWNSDKWISHWALAGKGDTYWWRGVFPAATATTVASQAKILGPVGNEHVENEHAGGLTALRLRELRRKEHADKQEKMFASAAAARILRSTFHAEERIRPFSFCTTERAQYLSEAIFVIRELETEATNLAGHGVRQWTDPETAKPSAFGLCHVNLNYEACDHARRPASHYTATATVFTLPGARGRSSGGSRGCRPRRWRARRVALP